MVHLVDTRAAPHGAPVLDEPFHIGLVDRRIDRIARDAVEDRMKGGVGLVKALGSGWDRPAPAFRTASY